MVTLEVHTCKHIVVQWKMSVKSTVFWDIIPCSLLKINWCFTETLPLSSGLKSGPGKKPAEGKQSNWLGREAGRKFWLSNCYAVCFLLVSCSAYSSNLKMEVICSSRMSVDFQQTAWPWIQENCALHNHCCGNLKSYRKVFVTCESTEMHPTYRRQCSDCCVYSDWKLN